MTGDQGNQPTPAPATPPADKPAAKATKDEAPAKAPLFAAYDVTLLKFIGGVVDSKAKAKAQEAYKAAEKAGHDLDIREV